MDFGDVLDGVRVALDQNRGALRPCRHCGCNEGVKQPPKGPHGNGIRCCDCGRHLGWLPKESAGFQLFDAG